MSEIIFILVTVYVAYVVYVVVNDNKASVAEKHEEVVVDAMIEAVNPGAAVEVTNTTVASDEVRNPKTGEVSKIPNNYRFGKRWIKEALVSEGLLEKVYKNSELNEEVDAKIQQALNALSALENYKV